MQESSVTVSSAQPLAPNIGRCCAALHLVAAASRCIYDVLPFSDCCLLALRRPGAHTAQARLPSRVSCPPSSPVLNTKPSRADQNMARGLAVRPAPPPAAAAAETPPAPDPTLAAALQRVMQAHWGLGAQFRPLQAEAVAATLAGRDSLLILPTGKC